MTALLAQFSLYPGTSIIGWAIWVVLVATACFIVKCYLQYMEITIPPIIVKILLGVLVAVVVIAALLFLGRMAGMG
jgi:hypothetical protein